MAGRHRKTVLTNARVVTRRETFSGTVVLAGGDLHAVDSGNSRLAGAEDCQGDFLIPGLIEVHTDNVERHMEPRPGVVWPSTLSALLAHDTQMVGAGITTVLDAVSVGDYGANWRRREMLGKVVEGIKLGREQGLFRADHFMHLRCEVSDKNVVELFEPYVDEPVVRLLSVMDHTPGQRQWRDLDKMRQFHSRKRTYTDAEFEAFVRERQASQRAYSVKHRRTVIEMWRPRNLPIASHDDTTEEHVTEALADGITIAEFPTTRQAAALADDRGMFNVMGSPNLVRGGSHSGNVSAGELADQGLLHGLSSDYVPVSLLHGAFKLHMDHGFGLPDAIATVTANVARMLRLEDRGTLAQGKRADVARVRLLPDGSAAVKAVWRCGERIM